MQDINLDIPKECGVMLLSGTSLFPSNSMILNIFEPRYRTMMEHALDGNWMFAVGDEKDGSAGADSGTVGLIRHCQHLPDGRYNLVLKGLYPVRFSDWDVDSPYPKAKISLIQRTKVNSTNEEEAIRSLITDSLPVHLEHLPKEIRESIISDLLDVPDLTALIDQVSHNFIADLDLRSELLSEIKDVARAHKLITALAI